MNLTFSNVLSAVQISLRNPRAFAQQLAGVEISRSNAWLLLVVSSLVGVFVNHFGTMATIDLNAVPENPMEQIILMNARMLLGNPFVHAIAATSILVIAVFLTFWVGRMFKGEAGFGTCILAVAWISFIWSILSAAQLAISFAFFPLASLVALIAMVLTLYQMANIIAGVHGFRSSFLVLGCAILTGFAAIFVFSFIVTLIGVSVPGVS